VAGLAGTGEPLMIANATTQLLTLDEVAERLHVAKSTVEEWVYAKDLGSFKKGGSRRVSEEDLTKFVLANTLNPRRPAWLTAEVESKFLEQLREVIRQEINAETQRRGERVAA
jgi:excisionase family DNA binding protein